MSVPAATVTTSTMAQAGSSGRLTRPSTWPGITLMAPAWPGDGKPLNSGRGPLPHTDRPLHPLVRKAPHG